MEKDFEPRVQATSPLTRRFRNPELDAVVLLPEQLQARSADGRDDQAQDDVQKRVARYTLAVPEEEPLHAADDEVLVF